MEPPPLPRFSTTIGLEKPLSKHSLKHIYDKGLERLSNMVRVVRDFPRTGVDFRHVLGITQQQGGLALCVSRLQRHMHSSGNSDKPHAVVSCEAGGFLFASA
jgi:adenine/guanine phosphoribosyltransferase-like PRPP-binding protein